MSAQEYRRHSARLREQLKTGQLNPAAAPFKASKIEDVQVTRSQRTPLRTAAPAHLRRETSHRTGNTPEYSTAELDDSSDSSCGAPRTSGARLIATKAKLPLGPMGVQTAPSNPTLAYSSTVTPVGAQLLRRPGNTLPNPQVIQPLPGKSKKKSKQQQNRKDKVYLVPSAASGGVPNPTQQYIIQASQPSSKLPVPRRILVVFDLNGTLLHRPNTRSPSKFIERPHSKEFMSYCIDTFTVAVWSSAREQNVRKMMAQLVTPEDEQKVVAIWGRDKLGLSKEDYNERVQCYKRLEKLWQDPTVRASHPEATLGRGWDQTNTVLVDDSVEKARSQPFNLIGLPEFEGDTFEEGFVLPQVHDYLNECSIQSDVSSFIWANPFKLSETFTLQPR